MMTTFSGQNVQDVNLTFIFEDDKEEANTDSMMVVDTEEDWDDVIIPEEDITNQDVILLEKGGLHTKSKTTVGSRIFRKLMDQKFDISNRIDQIDAGLLKFDFQNHAYDDDEEDLKYHPVDSRVTTTTTTTTTMKSRILFYDTNGSVYRIASLKQIVWCVNGLKTYSESQLLNHYFVLNPPTTTTAKRDQTWAYNTFLTNFLGFNQSISLEEAENKIRAFERMVPAGIGTMEMVSTPSPFSTKILYYKGNGMYRHALPLEVQQYIYEIHNQVVILNSPTRRWNMPGQIQWVKEFVGHKKEISFLDAAKKIQNFPSKILYYLVNGGTCRFAEPSDVQMYIRDLIVAKIDVKPYDAIINHSKRNTSGQKLWMTEYRGEDRYYGMTLEEGAQVVDDFEMDRHDEECGQIVHPRVLYKHGDTIRFPLFEEIKKNIESKRSDNFATSSTLSLLDRIVECESKLQKLEQEHRCQMNATATAPAASSHPTAGIAHQAESLNATTLASDSMGSTGLDEAVLPVVSTNEVGNLIAVATLDDTAAVAESTPNAAGAESTPYAAGAAASFTIPYEEYRQPSKDLQEQLDYLRGWPHSRKKVADLRQNKMSGQAYQAACCHNSTIQKLWRELLLQYKKQSEGTVGRMKHKRNRPGAGDGKGQQGKKARTEKRMGEGEGKGNKSFQCQNQSTQHGEASGNMIAYSIKGVDVVADAGKDRPYEEVVDTEEIRSDGDKDESEGGFEGWHYKEDSDDSDMDDNPWIEEDEGESGGEDGAMLLFADRMDTSGLCQEYGKCQNDGAGVVVSKDDVPHLENSMANLHLPDKNSAQESTMLESEDLHGPSLTARESRLGPDVDIPFGPPSQEEWSPGPLDKGQRVTDNKTDVQVGGQRDVHSIPLFATPNATGTPELEGTMQHVKDVLDVRSTLTAYSGSHKGAKGSMENIVNNADDELQSAANKTRSSDRGEESDTSSGAETASTGIIINKEDVPEMEGTVQNSTKLDTNDLDRDGWVRTLRLQSGRRTTKSKGGKSIPHKYWPAQSSFISQDDFRMDLKESETKDIATTLDAKTVVTVSTTASTTASTRSGNQSDVERMFLEMKQELDQDQVKYQQLKDELAQVKESAQRSKDRHERELQEMKDAAKRYKKRLGKANDQVEQLKEENSALQEERVQLIKLNESLNSTRVDRGTF